MGAQRLWAAPIRGLQQWLGCGQVPPSPHGGGSACDGQAIELHCSRSPGWFKGVRG